MNDTLDFERVLAYYGVEKPSHTSNLYWCPFHEDYKEGGKPNLSVDIDQGLFHCFVCSVGGNIISFVGMKELGIDSYDKDDPQHQQAAKAGLQKVFGNSASEALQSRSRPAPAKQVKRIPTETIHLLGLATKWYAMQIKKYPNVLKYLVDRGFTSEHIAQFQIGYAPFSKKANMGLISFVASWTRNRKRTEQLCEAAGLTSEKDDQGNIKELLAGRILFPDIGINGQVLSIVGRLFDKLPASKKWQPPKYKALKGLPKTCFYFDRVPFKAPYIIVTESIPDVLNLWQAGLYAVAVNGTYLQTRWRSLFVKKGFTGKKKIFLLQQNDTEHEAGQEAAVRWKDKFAEWGMKSKIVELPHQYKDFNEMVVSIGLDKASQFIRNRIR